MNWDGVKWIEVGYTLRLRRYQTCMAQAKKLVISALEEWQNMNLWVRWISLYLLEITSAISFLWWGWKRWFKELLMIKTFLSSELMNNIAGARWNSYCYQPLTWYSWIFQRNHNKGEHVDSINESKWRAGYNITNDWALFSLIYPLGRRRSIKLAPLDQYTIKLLLGSKFQNL